MRNLLAGFGVALAFALTASACATDVVALRPQAAPAPQGSLVTSLGIESPTRDCAPVHRYVDKVNGPGASTEFSLDAFVSALPTPKRYEFVRTLWDAHQRVGGDSRLSALLRRTLGNLVRDELCQGSS